MFLFVPFIVSLDCVCYPISLLGTQVNESRGANQLSTEAIHH